MKKCIILGNGEAPSKKVFEILKSSGYSTLFCADGGANTALRLGLIPEFIIGDFDSIKPDALSSFKLKSRLIKLTRQNDTDIEKCIKHAYRRKYDRVILVGATGDRLDHSFCNLGVALKYFDKIRIEILHKESILRVMTGESILQTLPGETVSIYGFDEKTKIVTKGLKYNLKGQSLPFGKRESTSNIALGAAVKLKIMHGKMFVIRNFKLLVDNDLFSF